MSSFTATLKKVIENDEDFEWYPTTDEIIQAIRKDIFERFKSEQTRIYKNEIHLSVLDCGAGDGRVLCKVTEGKKYAIEKSVTLLERLPSDIFVVGTDFHSQTLIDKQVDVITANPPFGEFEDWAYKIIKEGNCKAAYLIIPERWSKSAKIKQALESRSANAEKIGDFGFDKADRKARGTVNLVRVDIARYYREGYSRIEDPFIHWFEETFPLNLQENESSARERIHSVKRNLTEKIQSSGELIKQQGLINVLDDFYREDMKKLIGHYQAFTSIDPIVLCELGVGVNSVREGLKLRIEGLKNNYWQELFGRLKAISGRLTCATRQKLVDKLTSQTHVDFDANNAHAIVMWAIKNANEYFDEQLIDIVTCMMKKANVIAYKSNKKTFGDEDWRYCKSEREIYTKDRFKLDYRVIITSMGGDRGYDFIDDLQTLAYNIGFDTYGFSSSKERNWLSGKKEIFTFRNVMTGNEEVLFEAKGFYNGNLHLRFNQNFICSLNVEFGRLKGWLRSAAEACDELDITAEDAFRSFNSNMKLESKSTLLRLES